MKLLCTVICALGSVWSQLTPISLNDSSETASSPAATPLPVASLLSDRAARQAALDIGWDLAHALGHSSNIPNAGRTVPEMG